ncbi:glycoside hydrolase family 19 protein [Nocardia araoensis]|uniref:glycoside hydrolase family 19 protein n=1 Tax=Nocardia araoensis TaxID=228600 RepID=UPI0002D59E71|nr:glycoside hydrolase family 19 protein [Nocardia araoensis]
MGSRFDPLQADPWGRARYGLLALPAKLPGSDSTTTASSAILDARKQIESLVAPPQASATLREVVEFTRNAFDLMVDQLGNGHTEAIPDLIVLLDEADLYDVANESIVTTRYNEKSGKLARLATDLKAQATGISGKVDDVAKGNVELIGTIADEAARLATVLQAAAVAVSARSKKLSPTEERALLTEVVATLVRVETKFAAVAGHNTDRAGTMGPLTLEQLERIFPGTSREKPREYLPYLNQAMRDYGIDTPKREAAFLAQIGEETDDLKTLEEYGPDEYFNRNYGPESSVGRSLGNTKHGDGARFHGRGALQLTGRDNYQKAGEALGVDLVGDRELAADPKYAFATAGWFWDAKELNRRADESDFDAITTSINGGSTGAADRNENYHRARKVLHVK